MNLTDAEKVVRALKQSGMNADVSRGEPWDETTDMRGGDHWKIHLMTFGYKEEDAARCQAAFKVAKEALPGVNSFTLDDFSVHRVKIVDLKPSEQTR